MSHSAGLEAVNRSASPVGALKRKREASEVVYTRVSPHAGPTRSLRHVNGHLQSSSSGNNNSARGLSASDIPHASPSSDEIHQNENGDTLRGIGSASSRASAASSVFSHNSTIVPHHRKHSVANNLTPLTTHSDSSSPKGNSPHYFRPSTSMAHTSSALHVPASAIPHEPPHERPHMLPPLGKAKGYRAVWDPELDGKLSKEERKRAAPRRREFGTETYEPDPPPDPRLAIPGYVSGNCRPKTQPSKAILRIAPYTIQPYKIDRHSIGPGEAQQIVALGFDPFIPEATLRLNFSSFGSIASVQNKTDPETGSFLGIALIKYRDSLRDGVEVTAVSAAKRAESEFNGARIGTSQVRVELDREGRKCKRYVEYSLKRAKETRAKENPVAPPPPPPEEASETTRNLLAPPPNAPKGPSGKASTKLPEGPRGTTATAAPPNSKAGAAALIEEELVLGKIKRKPYIFIPHSSVPVLGTTIPHLKKRLKSYDWREVRLDRTGYFVVFDDSKRGEDETERCFVECNKAALFTYTMEMECQKYGNPDYERSPSPERAMAEQQKRAQLERLWSEEEADMEIEKKNRAENLDPVEGVLERLRTELRDKIMDDIKTRIAISIFHDSLEPTKHATKRKKLGLPDTSDIENKAPTLLFNKAGDTPPHTPKTRHGHPLSHSKPLRPHDPNQQRGRKSDRDKGPSNAFADERRRRPAPKPSHARGLHFRLQQMFAEEEDSDDERHTSLTRDTEDQESRPLSRASRNSTPASESVTETPKHKRRKVTEWDDDDKETFDAFHKEMLGHLLHKEPEDLATRELELVVNTLPRTSKYATRARTELFIRQRSKADDDLFQVKTDNLKPLEGVSNETELLSQDRTDAQLGDGNTKIVKEKAKRKRKTKKQILEEQEALKQAEKRAQAESKQAVLETIAQTEEKELESEPEAAEEAVDKDVELGLTYDKPRRTVEEDRAVILDIDGWQHFVKDDEDLAFAKKALADQLAQDVGDARFWAWRQKEIKTLNVSQGIHGTRSECLIPGYYVPNPSGCARTEGVIKILNEEKSKYLPHRIKVQKAREERQALATSNPTAAAEAARITAAEKFASTATSRSNRVNNRRLVNDINLQKQNMATANSDADVAIRFNQLKKRKKLVKFDRSAIHGWGLYAEENIAVNDLIIEYVGEKVRQKVADLRELKYEKQGIGSSYLFRMVDDEIVDATKKGGIARFINHSCSPNCTAKIIKVEGTPRIVIYAMKDIMKNEELTYDYKFEREYGSTDRIPCLCGSANCKGFLN